MAPADRPDRRRGPRLDGRQWRWSLSREYDHESVGCLKHLLGVRRRRLLLEFLLARRVEYSLQKDSLPGNAGPRRLCAELKPEHGLSDEHVIAVLELADVGRRTVDDGAVAAPEIPTQIAVAGRSDLDVTARGSGVSEDETVVRGPPDDEGSTHSDPAPLRSFPGDDISLLHRTILELSRR